MARALGFRFWSMRVRLKRLRLKSSCFGGEVLAAESLHTDSTGST